MYTKGIIHVTNLGATVFFFNHLNCIANLIQESGEHKYNIRTEDESVNVTFTVVASKKENVNAFIIKDSFIQV